MKNSLPLPEASLVHPRLSLSTPGERNKWRFGQGHPIKAGPGLPACALSLPIVAYSSVCAPSEKDGEIESEIGAVRDAERASERASVCVEEDFLLKIGSPMALALGIAEKKGYRGTGESSNV